MVSFYDFVAVEILGESAIIFVCPNGLIDEVW
jgi:hypothetical protein